MIQVKFHVGGFNDPGWIIEHLGKAELLTKIQVWKKYLGRNITAHNIYFDLIHEADDPDRDKDASSSFLDFYEKSGWRNVYSIMVDDIGSVGYSDQKAW